MNIINNKFQDTLDDLSWVKCGECLILFGENIKRFSRILKPLIDRNIEFNFDIVYPDNCVRELKEYNFDGMINYVSELDVTSFYLISYDECFAIYSNNRDNLTVLHVNCKELSDYLPRIDAAFSKVVRGGGVGFGKEGRDYMADLMNGHIDVSRIERIL